MIKEKKFSANFDFHTGIIAKSCFFISILLLVIALGEILFSIIFIIDSSSLIALSLLFLGLTGISWFFHSQFSKLSDIASEIENEDTK